MLSSREIVSGTRGVDNNTDRSVVNEIRKELRSLPSCRDAQKNSTGITNRDVLCFEYIPESTGKKAPSYISSRRGSLTVEAAVTVPLFLFAVYILWIFYGVMGIHIQLQTAAEDVTGELAQQSFLLEAWQSGTEDAGARGELAGMTEGLSFGSMLSQSAWIVYARSRIVDLVGRDVIDASPIVSGAGGLYLLGSSWNKNGDLDLRMDYQVEIPILLGFSWRMPMTQHSLRRCWTGSHSMDSDDQREGEEIVYITPSGSVYHRDVSCFHLLLTVREIPGGSVGGAMNNSGNRYTPCELCADGVSSAARLYVAASGDRYHTTRDCSSLRRTVNAVPLSQAGGRRACSSCGS